MSVLLSQPRSRFGQAEVIFGRQTMASGPQRVGAEIRFPFEFDEAEMHSLMDGQQFLLVESDSRRPYFGGTDEAPFMVRLDTVHLQNFELGGETAFYDGLKPEKTKGYEEMFGTSAVRQGDIWAVPVPMSWDKLCGYYRRTTGGQRGLRICTGRRDILRTRHTIDGRWVKGKPRFPFDDSRHRGRYLRISDMVAEGTMTAPDHEPLVLYGPHVLARTAGILAPTRFMPE